MIDASAPFVLLDDARASGAAPARLYRKPAEILAAYDAKQLESLLGRLRQATRAGQHAAGFLAYEAGYILERSLSPSAACKSEKPLAWFGLFDKYQEFSGDCLVSMLPDPDGGWLSRLQPDTDYSGYRRAFDSVQEYIRAGDIYQANLTFRASAAFSGHPLALYAALRDRAAAGYGGVIWTGDDWHLSFSPELFFALRGGHITTRPMKGTAARSADRDADAHTRRELQCDSKQRAENLMIVDLLRNDLSRVCAAGSVEVPELFKIESYPTIHQMVSTVTGDLQPDLDIFDAIRALFPCGSITGAPKIRAMEIISEQEAAPRGLYCGSMGRIDPTGDAAFNVAIRTFSLCKGESRVSLGLGSGVVADSQCTEEWAECLAKGEFAKLNRRFDLIETMRFEPSEGILRLQEHLARMKQSAAELGFAFDRHEARNRLHAATFHVEKPSRIRLLLSAEGDLAIEIRPFDTSEGKPITAEIVPLPVDSSDFRLRHKTTDRAFYDHARHKSAADEVLFVDSEGFLTEASYMSIFVERDGLLLTPPLERGLLPGVLRSQLIEAGEAREAELRPDELKDGFLLGNSLRGLCPARLADNR